MFDPLVHVGVAAVLTRETMSGREVLLLRRGANATHGANTWGLPGGWIDWGQTPAQAAARELLEEVNVRVSEHEGKLWGAVANTHEAEQMHVICVAIHFPHYDDSDLANLEPEKCDAVSWVPVKELSKLALFPALRSHALEWGWVQEHHEQGQVERWTMSDDG